MSVHFLMQVQLKMLCKTLAKDSLFLIRCILFANVSSGKNALQNTGRWIPYFLFVNVSSAQNDLQNTGPGFHISNKIYFICKCKFSSK